MTDEERIDAAEQQPAADEQPQAEKQAEATAEEKQQVETAPRMPGLWIVCVLLGLAGVFTASLAVLGTPGGRVVFGVLAALDFAVAVGLWRRRSVAWYGALGLVAVKAVCWVVNYGSALGGAPWAIGAIVLNVGIGVYLVARRPAFVAGAMRRPCLAGGAALCAAAVVVVVGAGWWWLLFADAPKPMFPMLLIGFPTGRGSNGFPSMKKIMAQCRPAGQAAAIEKLLKEAPAPGGAAAAGWSDRAKTLVDKNEAWLKLVDAVLKAPQFFPPHLPAGAKWYARDVSWLKGLTATVRLLALDSDVRLAAGDVKGAVQDAQKALNLSTKVLGRADSLLTFQAAADATALALEQVRTVAAAAKDPALLPGKMKELVLGHTAANGLGWALAAEYRNAVAMTGTVGKPSADGSAARRGPFTRMIAKAPCAKPHMTADVIGRALSDYAREAEGHKPWDDVGDAVRHARSGRDLVGALGWLQVARNGAGDEAAIKRLAGMGDVIPRRLAITADARLTRIDLALRACQLKQGKLPEGLSALAPDYMKAVPSDPFTGKPFGYDPTGAQPRIWSVGPDQRTDPPGKKEGDDVVIPLAFAGS